MERHKHYSGLAAQGTHVTVQSNFALNFQFGSLGMQVIKCKSVLMCVYFRSPTWKSLRKQFPGSLKRAGCLILEEANRPTELQSLQPLQAGLIHQRVRGERALCSLNRLQTKLFHLCYLELIVQLTFSLLIPGIEHVQQRKSCL